MAAKSEVPLRRGRVRTPMLIQMEMVECGAAALGIILSYHGRIVPLATLRRDCGVSRDGSNGAHILRAAKAYGLVAKAFKKDLAELRSVPYPYIVFWRFNHFLVVEGCGKNRVYLNDPASGPRQAGFDEFDRAYTGIVMTFEPGPEFRRGGRKPGILAGIWKRIQGSLGSLCAATFTALLLVVPGLATPALMEAFVDKVLVQGLHDWGRPLVVGMLLAALLRALLGAIQLRILRRLQIRLAVVNSARFVKHLLRLPASYYAQRYAGEVSSRIALNDRVAELLSGRLATASIDALMIIFYAAVMWQFNRALTGVALAFAAMNLSLMAWIAKQRKEGNVRFSMASGRTAGVSIAGLQSIRTIKASALESDFFARWAGFFANLSMTHQDLSIVNYYLGVLPPLLSSLMTASVLIVGGFEVIGGRMSIGMLVAFQSLAASFLLPVNNLVALGASIQDLEADLSRLDDVLGNGVEHIRDSEDSGRPAAGLPTGRELLRLTGNVEFRHVTFGYSPVTPPLIHDLSFAVRPGHRIAFVGPSGSGKSTVAKLLAGIYKPVSGEILFDGVPIEEIPREVISISMSMVDQDILLFKGNVRENITLWDASTPEASIHRACQDALVASVIDALPEGYASELLEGAANLSGGQRQRLEIARALASDPAILIMDEATSALDAETEELVDRNIRARGCSCFIVAHRLSTVRHSDEIVVLEAGRVVQRGTHEKLIREEGMYARLLAETEAPGAVVEVA
jgi:ATP-binding cassette, subfamily C, bacterial